MLMTACSQSGAPSEEPDSAAESAESSPEATYDKLSSAYGNSKMQPVDTDQLYKAMTKGYELQQHCGNLCYETKEGWDVFKGTSDNTYYYDAEGETLTVKEIPIDAGTRIRVDEAIKSSDWSPLLALWTDGHAVQEGGALSVPGAQKAWRLAAKGDGLNPDYYGCIIVGDDNVYHVFTTTTDASSSPFLQDYGYFLATFRMDDAIGIEKDVFGFDEAQIERDAERADLEIIGQEDEPSAETSGE